MPVLTLTLDKDESVYAQSGSMVMLAENIVMDTQLIGGLIGGMRRVAGGEPMYVTQYTSTKDGSRISFSDEAIGAMIPFEVSDVALMCDRSSFLCCETTVDFQIAFMKRIRDALFSGEGVVLQKLTGTGRAFLHSWGEVDVISLADGEKIRVSSGKIVAFDETVSLITRMMKGAKNIVFGKEGLFITELTGPGKVYIQSIDRKEFRELR